MTDFSEYTCMFPLWSMPVYLFSNICIVTEHWVFKWCWVKLECFHSCLSKLNQLFVCSLSIFTNDHHLLELSVPASTCCSYKLKAAWLLAVNASASLPINLMRISPGTIFESLKPCPYCSRSSTVDYLSLWRYFEALKNTKYKFINKSNVTNKRDVSFLCRLPHTFQCAFNLSTSASGTCEISNNSPRFTQSFLLPFLPPLIVMLHFCLTELLIVSWKG